MRSGVRKEFSRRLTQVVLKFKQDIDRRRVEQLTTLSPSKPIRNKSLASIGAAVYLIAQCTTDNIDLLLAYTITFKT